MESLPYRVIVANSHEDPPPFSGASVARSDHQIAGPEGVDYNLKGECGSAGQVRAAGRKAFGRPVLAVAAGETVVFSEIDRNLLERCLARKPRGWEDFVNRFLALFYQVVDHTASLFNLELSPSDRDDICAEILLRLVENDFAILRRFRGQASLASYLAVVGRAHRCKAT